MPILLLLKYFYSWNLFDYEQEALCTHCREILSS